MTFVPRIGQINAVLVAIYLVPVGGIEAVRTLMSPVYGLDNRVNLSTASYYRRLLDLEGEGLMRISTILASLKLVMAAMFVALAIDVARGIVVKRDTDPATIDAALLIAALTIIVWAIPAYAGGNGELIRLYATQFLLVIGAAIVVLVERTSAPAPATPTRASMWLALSEVDKMRADAMIAMSPPTVNVVKFDRAREPEPTA